MQWNQMEIQCPWQSNKETEEPYDKNDSPGVPWRHLAFQRVANGEKSERKF